GSRSWSVLRLVQLELGECKRKITQASQPVGGRVFFGPVDRERLLLRGYIILEQLASRFGRNFAVEEEFQKQIDGLLVGLEIVFLHEFRRVGSTAEAIVFGRGQRQGKVLTKEQRLSVEPSRAAIPALDRRRKEEILAKLFQRLCE